jgi:hypothetical protein
MDTRQLAIDAKRKHDELTAPQPGRPLEAAFNMQKSPYANAMILQYLVNTGTAPYATTEFSFIAMIKAVANAGPNYSLPDRRTFGACSKSGIDGLGLTLVSELERTRVLRSQLLDGVEFIGGCLASDGAKWKGRSLINTILQSALGNFFVQSTDATGQFKSAEFYKEDLEKAIVKIGPKYVFTINLDGGCLKTLKLIWKDPKMNTKHHHNLRTYRTVHRS